jgi:2-methylcitrate dehydratase PrpD
MSALDNIAEFAETLKFDDLSTDSLENVKLIVLDTLGAILAGENTALGETAARTVPLSGFPEATVIATGRKTDLLSAIQTNCAAAHCSEIDCIHPGAIVCLGGMVVPAALSWAEKTGCSGKAFITAVAAGSETAIRVGVSARAQDLLAAGWWPSALFGPLGVCSAIGKLEGLSRQMQKNALEINTTVSGGLINGNAEGATARHFLYGWAARGGAASVLAAKAGFTGPNDGLDIPHGLFRSRGVDPDLTGIASGLGATFHLNETAYKEYASAMQSQSAIHAFTMLLKTHAITAEMIDRVTVRLPKKAFVVVSGGDFPKNHTAAAAHGPYLIAAAMHCGDVLPRHFDREFLTSPKIRGFAARVHLEEAPELEQFAEHWPATVKIRLKDGRTPETMIVDWMGEEGRKAFVTKKFKRITAEALSNAQAERIIANVDALETLPDVSVLVQDSSKGYCYES